MINLNKFVEKYNNQYVDVDNAYGHQCFDLSARWIIDNEWGTGYYCQWTGGVRDLIEHFNEIQGINRDAVEMTLNNPNDPNQLPPAGAVIVYDWGRFGHVEIVVEARGDSMTTLGQNLGDGSGEGYGNRTQLVTNRQYDRILGWVSEKAKVTQANVITETPKQRDLDSELSPFSNYFYPERIKVIQDAYNIGDKDYLVFELKGAGETASNLTIENMKLSQKIAAVEKLEQESANKAKEKAKISNAPDIVKDEPKTTVIEPVVKSKTIFESKKAIMSIAATLITIVVTFLNKKLDMNLNVTEILAVVSPLLLGVVVQGSTEIIK
jgi:CHAP domain